MNASRRIFLCGTLVLVLGSGVLPSSLAQAPATTPSGYFNDFEHAAPGKIPDDLQVANGDFTVRREGAHAYLELAPDPLDTDGILFGPGDSPSLDVSARIWADRTAARFPEFGIGSNDVGGYKLWVWPAHGTIELRKADDAVASKPFAWMPGKWLRLRLRVTQVSAGRWRIQGKAWPDGASEPTDWLLSFDDSDTPNPGKASIWGIPFSGKPIRFDDLVSKSSAS